MNSQLALVLQGIAIAFFCTMAFPSFLQGMLGIFLMITIIRLQDWIQ